MTLWWPENISRPNFLTKLFISAMFLGLCLSGLLYRDGQLSYLHNFPSESDAEWLEKNVKKTKFVVNTAGYKTILMWTRWNAEVLHFSAANQPDWLDDCSEARCLFLSSRDQHQNADAIFFSMTDFSDLQDRPAQLLRRPEQYYVFHVDESPETMMEMYAKATSKWDELDDFFNLTMTYRRDSDVFSDGALRGYVPHIINVTARDPLWFEGKRDVLWMVSHCKTSSKREEYVRRLSHYVKVNEYGQCDTPDPCRARKNCDLDRLTANYKFYLAFENSFCKDYVTEKLIRALNSDVVPIVLGDANYSSLFPDSAVINAEHFESPKELAKYLQSLIMDGALYERHLSWKYPGQRIWQIPGLAERKHTGRMCKLCELLHRPAEKRIQKTYSSVKRWWFDGQCRGRPIPPIRPKYVENKTYHIAPRRNQR